jgi:hypothetical protein
MADERQQIRSDPALVRLDEELSLSTFPGARRYNVLQLRCTGRYPKFLRSRVVGRKGPPYLPDPAVSLGLRGAKTERKRQAYLDSALSSPRYCPKFVRPVSIGQYKQLINARKRDPER